MSSIRSFIRLLSRFLSGRATPKDEEIVERWYSALDEENDFPHLDPEEADAMHAEDYEAIRKQMKHRSSPMLSLWPSVAAAAAVVIGITFFFYKEGDESNSPQVASAQEFSKTFLQAGDSIYNSLEWDSEVWLADSSSVVLKPKSSLVVAATFNGEGRHVTLEGEGFFKIKRDEKRPFRVFTYGIVTQVLGTSFIVRAPSEHEQIAVQVKTGKVAVLTTQGKESDRVVLTPNQQVTFYPKEKRLTPALVENPVALVSEERTTKVYDEADVERVLTDISEAYGVDISCDQKVRSCKITTAFKDEGLYDRLEILTKAIGAQYKVDGTRVIIESNRH